MRVLLLGPVTVVTPTGAQRLRSERQAALLAILSLAGGASVSRSRLEDVLWGDAPPATAHNTLQVHASGLRRILGAEALSSDGDGYRLHMDRAEVDATRFSELVERGTDALNRGHHPDASRVLRSALALWRGEPFAGLYGAVLDAERARLEGIRLAAMLARIDADLGLGRHLTLEPEVRRLADENPYDERVAARLMVVLYRAGRQVDALDVFDQMRHRLRDELGVDPGEELTETRAAVLRHHEVVRLPPGVRALQAPWRTPILGRHLHPLVGREALLPQAAERLRPGSVVTLVGPSGVGKTRLALEVAERLGAELPAGVALVRPSEAEDIDALLAQIGARLELPAVGNARAETELVLGTGGCLVVLDDLTADDAERLALETFIASTDTPFLATSSRALGLAHERVLPVPPLRSVEADGRPGPAATLLCELAGRAGAPAPAEAGDLISCADLLDGLPLALELAAPLAVLGWPELRRQLMGRDLAQGAVAVSFESSLRRLDTAERRIIDLLATVGAPVDLELLEVMAGPQERIGSILARLVRDGLARAGPGSHGAVVYDELPSVRDQVLARQDPTRRAAARRAVVHAIAATYTTGAWYSPSVLRTADQARRWMAILPAAEEAARIAEEDGLVLEAARLVPPLNELVFADRGLDHPRRTTWLLDLHDLHVPERIDVLIVASMAALWNSQPTRGWALIGEAVELSRRHRDRARLAMALVHQRLLHLASGVGDDDLSGVAEADAIACELDDQELTAALRVLPSGSSDDAERLADALRRAREIDHLGLQLLCLANAADMALERGHLDTSRTLALEAGALATDLHNRYLAGVMAATAQAAAAISGDAHTLSLTASALRRAHEVGDVRTTTDVLLKLAAGAHHSGRPAAATRCVAAYRAVLARWGAEPNSTETTFLQTWLSDYAGVRPRAAADEEVSAALQHFAEHPSSASSAR